MASCACLCATSNDNISGVFNKAFFLISAYDPKGLLFVAHNLWLIITLTEAIKRLQCCFMIL